ncbi:MAG TPA: hypothetical protein VFR67_17560, partial [Pilimelia sp.]|nr:hypothetical protein [Pilimelia sp.]
MGAEQSRVTGEPADDVATHQPDRGGHADDADMPDADVAARETAIGYRWATEEPDALPAARRSLREPSARSSTADTATPGAGTTSTSTADSGPA